MESINADALLITWQHDNCLIKKILNSTNISWREDINKVLLLFVRRHYYLLKPWEGIIGSKIWFLDPSLETFLPTFAISFYCSVFRFSEMLLRSLYKNKLILVGSAIPTAQRSPTPQMTDSLVDHGSQNCLLLPSESVWAFRRTTLNQSATTILLSAKILQNASARRYLYSKRAQGKKDWIQSFILNIWTHFSVQFSHKEYR